MTECCLSAIQKKWNMRNPDTIEKKKDTMCLRDDEE